MQLENRTINKHTLHTTAIATLETHPLAKQPVHIFSIDDFLRERNKIMLFIKNYTQGLI